MMQGEAKFSVGHHSVSWTATDDAGNVSDPILQTIIITDTTPPVITLSSHLTFEARSSLSTIKYENATASDIFTPVVITNDAPATFPLGDTTITWSATDANGLTSTATQTITITDTKPPVIKKVPDDIVIVTVDDSAVIVSFKLPTATDKVDGAVDVVLSHQSNSLFPIR